MESGLFRKSPERISSPERLNEYIRITTGVWVILVGCLASDRRRLWGFFGSIPDSQAEGVMFPQNSTAWSYRQQAPGSTMCGQVGDLSKPGRFCRYPPGEYR